MNTKRVGDQTERIVRKWFEAGGWIVEKARVSRGAFDLVCYSYKNGKSKKLFIQTKTNMREPRKIEDFFLNLDDAYGSTAYERIWIIRWTKGPHKGYLEVYREAAHEFVEIPKSLRRESR